MEWLYVIGALLSGGVSAGVVLGVTRTQVASLRREIEILRLEHKDDIRECRQRLDKLVNGRDH